MLTESERHEIEHAIHHYEDPRRLHRRPENRPETPPLVPDGAIALIAELLSISAADVEGVATFTIASTASRLAT